MSTNLDEAGRDQIAAAWSLLLTAARRAREGGGSADPESALGSDAAGRPTAVPRDSGLAWMLRRPGRGWACAPHTPPDVRALLELYLPVCNASHDAPLVVGHLGQSLDGHIATASGDSYYVTGPENLLHLHRMRALCDAVVVGAETVSIDNPQLTARLAGGTNPARVILDPRRRLAAKHDVFTDERAPTLLVCDRRCTGHEPDAIGRAEVVGVAMRGRGLDLDAVLCCLRARGLCSIFVEGGGATVSAFLEAGVLDRLQVAIAPVVTGAGRPGIRLPARALMDDCLRPAYRVFSMGGDVLFDCDLRGGPAESPAGGTARIL